jgi:hypothetical protein
VVHHLGITMKDLWPHYGERRESRTVVATYDYTDEQGTVLYQTVRTFPKSFYQRRSDGNGGWVNELNGARRVPYRLPAVMKAVKNGDPIFIAEGEKDADDLVRAGVCATTNAGGLTNGVPDSEHSWQGHLRWSSWPTGMLPGTREPPPSGARWTTRSVLYVSAGLGRV